MANRKRDKYSTLSRIIILLSICCGLFLISGETAMVTNVFTKNLSLQDFPIQSLKLAGQIIPSKAIYQQRQSHNPDGIGKFYMNREIAQVMGHLGAGWLERSSREWEEKPSLIVKNLNLEPTNVVADIGAGTGYLAFKIASLVPQGKVLAVDVQPEMLEIIDFFKKEKNISNVEPVLGEIASPNLTPSSVDLALMVDAYHEFEYPFEMMQGIVNALKPGGRVVLVEYRGENPFILIKTLHKMTQKQVRQEMSAVGLVWKEIKSFLPQQHLMIFEKPVSLN